MYCTDKQLHILLNTYTVATICEKSFKEKFMAFTDYYNHKSHNLKIFYLTISTYKPDPGTILHKVNYCKGPHNIHSRLHTDLYYHFKEIK